MALGLSSAFVELFSTEVHQAYQGSMTLQGCVRTQSGVEGNTYKFPKIGKGVAQTRIPQTDVVPLNVTYSQVTATLNDYIAAEYSDIFSSQRVNFDERRELVQVLSNAIGRRHDQEILDALINSGTSLTVANSIGGSNTNLNVAKLRNAKQLLDAKNVPPTDRHIAIHANSLANLLSETSVTSSDFNTVKALVSGEVNTFLGFNFYVLGDRDEGGLPIDGSSDRDCFVWQKNSVGLAVGLPIQTKIDYVPEKTSFLVASMFSAGAKAIDAEGIVKITCRES
tara:strand:- start:1228 stop:2070 length:843 start_codon:yes stop_codon:yes gene_type:complete